MRHLLIVDDEQALREMVAHGVSKFYETHTAVNAMDAINVLEEMMIDLAIIDVTMPGMNGFDLCARIKDEYEIPVIMLTARSALNDKRQAFEAGTDDYVTKPFEMEELLFRINAVLARYGSRDLLELGNVTVIESEYAVEVDGQEMYFPRKEFELLNTLIKNYPNVLTRDQLIETVWGYDFDGDERTVDVHIKRIRKRLTQVNSGIEIDTVRGVGYKVSDV
ncbi:response regulator transcription factor [Phocicoccus pinnipedialis]|uniref:Heme response regulator HssR n=1 Tax=Phocicoccus pinnipedialis TaxID=110845 RepID=A0A6V7R3X6_9BACL|nr:response regulator transcription factor [Jeotgalicoccus pinnipedialis]MBP1940012.1 DNA-binding response OmpR family regulator [Jeotgalicoccus pinnipedialis]CAD2072040.1 Heme response regulator HssR [Jeotgalicoccus pinnipedialis]